MILSDRFKAVALSAGLPRRYVLIAVLYGLSTLIIPLATQFLVNSLALSSLLANTVIFLLLLLIFLTLSQILRYGQLILIEYIQREIFVKEAGYWKGKIKKDKSHYMLEIQTLMKSFSQAFGQLVEFSLSMFFGFLVIIALHPAYIPLTLITALVIALVFRTWDKALATSVDESTEKYLLVETKFQEKEISENELVDFLSARNRHFSYIKRATILIGSTFVLSQLYLLGIGIVLIESNQLSVGQLVSAEIILTGIMVSFAKLPKTMEALYDFETSKIKLETALGEKYDA